ncbi:MAG: hypothetical protein ACP5J3_13075, partial [Pyrobaculum sp.]
DTVLKTPLNKNLQKSQAPPGRAEAPSFSPPYADKPDSGPPPPATPSHETAPPQKTPRDPRAATRPRNGILG